MREQIPCYPMQEQIPCNPMQDQIPCYPMQDRIMIKMNIIKVVLCNLSTTNLFPLLLLPLDTIGRVYLEEVLADGQEILVV